MNAVKFGKLVAALRCEHRWPDGKTWTQGDLSNACGLPPVSVNIISNIEQGVRVNLDENILCCLALALKLTSRERREFFYAASRIEEEDVARPGQDAKEVLQRQREIIESISLPAFISDVYGDIVLANAAIINILGITQDSIYISRDQPASYNILNIVFNDQKIGFRQLVGRSNWEKYARHNVHLVKAHSLRYRYQPHFVEIYNLLDKNPQFQIFWMNACEDNEDHYSTSLHYNYEHRVCKSLSYFSSTSLSVTSHGELFMTVYLPATKHTADEFTKLANQSVPLHQSNEVSKLTEDRAKKEVFDLAKWPKEEV